jgi:hypothetical protein
MIQIGNPRRPHVLRDRVLIRDPEQRSRVGHDRVVDDAVFLRHFDALQPLRKALGDVLLPEPLLADSRRIPLHRHRPAAQVRQHHRRDRLVIGSELSLGDAVIGEEHLVRVRDHPSTSLGATLSLSKGHGSSLTT